MDPHTIQASCLTCDSHSSGGPSSSHAHTSSSGIGRCFSMEGFPFLRTQNLISSTKYAMNLLVQKKLGGGAPPEIRGGGL